MAGHYDAFTEEKPTVKVFVSEPSTTTKNYSAGGFDVALDATETPECLSENRRREMAVQVSVCVPKKVAGFRIGKTEIYRGSKRLLGAPQSYDAAPNRKILESLVEEASGAVYEKLGCGEYPDSAMAAPATWSAGQSMLLLGPIVEGINAKESAKYFKKMLVEELSAMTGMDLKNDSR